MSLEIKQLVIKSEVKDKDNNEIAQVNGADISCELDEFKTELLNHCRKIVAEQLRKSKER
ncbi:DUF5908 family protein [Thalassotalea atypica]|uniref:DUF5908 family protein n=1 Tax=Thalassotalea atypica TaxID=2054316 RepID=UPI0025737356|nr:DUF5908 family protein [Thalassotalea atypica]